MSQYAVVDPATGDVVQEYPTATDEQMEQALAAAAKAHREWSRSSTVAKRAALIKQVAKLINERRVLFAIFFQR
jgi:succinate-semialdehyde dehydrogenase/glutarate-semialdehyde dehydrogenase